MAYHIEFKNPHSQLKYRILKIREILDENKPKYKENFLAIHPEYNNKKGLDLIANVMSCVTTDEQLTQRLEAFVDGIRKSKKVKAA